MKYILIILLALIMFIISVMLGAQNNQIVTFNYLLSECQFRVSTLLITLFTSGFISGWVICGLFWIRIRLILMRAERTIKWLKKNQNLDSESSSVTVSSNPFIMTPTPKE